MPLKEKLLTIWLLASGAAALIVALSGWSAKTPDPFLAVYGVIAVAVALR
jgi:uncharacterized membrane protein HdeD (DUF308 family)